MKPITLNAIDHAILQLALDEDLNGQSPKTWLDVTTDTLFPHALKKQRVKIICKNDQPVIVCGIAIIEALLSKFDEDFELFTRYKDGDTLHKNETLLTLECSAKTLLKAERTLLNLLRHLCAIATLTHQFVQAVKGTHTKILDTRKTTPGMRHLEKYAVQCGGGVNHRMGLYDAFMVKDTHVDLLGGMEKVLAKLPDKTNNKLPVIIEIRNQDELDCVIAHGKNKVDRVLLDNMTLKELKASVQKCKGLFQTESSGNINLKTIKAIAKTGVDYTSIGQLTYAAGQVDLSMVG